MTLSVKAEVTERLEADIAERLRRQGLAVQGVVAGFGAAVQRAWRADVSAALGRRLAGAVRLNQYPNTGLNAAALVFTKSPKIIGAHDRGAVIGAGNGLFLAIPLPAARRAGARRESPGQWQFRTGRKLRFVPTPKGGVLVADDVRVNPRGLAVKRRGRGKFEARRATTAVPIFALVRQVKLPKRLNLDAAARSATAGLALRVRVALGAGEK